MNRDPLPLQALQAYTPDRPSSVEAIWQPQYDFQSYSTGGVTQQVFFQLPVGQGGKTLADTNMKLGGQFPSPTGFLITAVMVVYLPNFAGDPSTTAAAATVATNLNDVTRMANRGYLTITIGSKDYLTDGPLGKFPPNFGVGGVSSLAGTYAAGTQVLNDYARSVGRYYEITPLYIPTSQNFNVSLNWPTAVTVAVTGRIGVILDGFYYRNSQ
jgi:hypothetical protein